jgi:PTS system N-acetylglucosamine-specific IIC component
LIQPGGKVKAGQPVLELDLDFLAANAVSTISPVVLANADEFGALSAKASGLVVAGETVLYQFHAL